MCDRPLEIFSHKKDTRESNSHYFSTLGFLSE